uniref:Uncharacterized protein n=1 Tax=Kalanchoe fedtschenkoi TaxID=63787 RepID=A0A7N0V7S9_KALFE
MVGVFRRTASFPNKNPSAPKPARHIRSASLPCARSSHPLVSALNDDLLALKTWAAAAGSSKIRTSGWLCDGLTQLRNVHDSLHDYMQLSHARAALQDCPDFVEKLLDEFLEYVDAYGLFQQSLLGLKEAQRVAHLGMRKRDQAKLHEYEKGAKKMNREMSKLVSSVKCIEGGIMAGVAGEVAAIIKDVSYVTAVVSAALFNGVYSQSSKWKKARLLPPWIRVAEKEKIDLGIEEFKEVSTLERVEELGEVIDCIEACSERVFRGLIITRVSLLNVLTQ